MPRLSRIVVPGLPHHVTQRGNRGERIFLREGDQARYLGMLAERVRAEGVEVWAYCLMPNHVHMVLVPPSETALARAVGECHRQYTSFINGRHDWVGHLFQSRFASVVMDESHLWNAILYVSLNPVRAGLCRWPEAWPWSSVKAHLRGLDDGVVHVQPVLERFGDFESRLRAAQDDLSAYEPAFAALRRSERSGRPFGSPGFVSSLVRS